MLPALGPQKRPAGGANQHKGSLTRELRRLFDKLTLNLGPWVDMGSPLLHWPPLHDLKAGASDSQNSTREVTGCEGRSCLRLSLFQAGFDSESWAAL